LLWMRMTFGVLVAALVFGQVHPIINEEYRRARKDGFWDADCERAYLALERQQSRLLDEDMIRSGSGIVVSVAGDKDFVIREVIPAIRWFQEFAKNKAQNFRTTVFAESGLLTPKIRNSFDTVIEEITSQLTPLAFRVKAFKIRAMARSPYDRTLYLDLDSRPCDTQGVFLKKLWPLLDNADLVLADNYAGQDKLVGTIADLRREHASGLVLLRSSSLNTRQLLADYASAHAILKNTRRGRRDQPALMVALRLAVEKKSNPLRLAHIPRNAFCRKNTSDIVSCDAGCLVVHKAARYDLAYKFFGIGFKKTGTTTLAAALRTLKIGPEPNHADSVAATIALLKQKPDAALALRAARQARAMTDAPWCLAASRGNLLAKIAHTYPRAKFILTRRPTINWWISTRNWLSCLKPFNIDRYKIMLNAANFSRSEFTVAYERYNQRVLQFFSSSSATDQLLVLDLDANTPFPWSQLCAFVEAWGKCPTDNDLRRNSFFQSDFAVSHPEATPSRYDLQLCSSASIEDDNAIIAHGLRRRDALVSRNEQTDKRLASLVALRSRRQKYRDSLRGGTLSS